MHWYERILKVSVHDEISVRQPDITMVMDGVEKLELTVVILKTRIEPLLLQQEFHLVFLERKIN